MSDRRALEKELDELVTRNDYWTDEKVQIRVREINNELYGPALEKELAMLATNWDMVAPELVAERDRLEAANAGLKDNNAELVAALKDTTQRFYRCLLSTGSALKYADIAVSQARAAIAKGEA